MGHAYAIDTREKWGQAIYSDEPPKGKPQQKLRFVRGKPTGQAMDPDRRLGWKLNVRPKTLDMRHKTEDEGR